MTCSRDNDTAIKRALAHNTTAEPLTNARTASWTAHSAAQRESADVEARMKAITAAMTSSPLPLLTHVLTSVPSAIACVSSATPVTSAACASVGTDTAASRVPRTSPSSPPVASSDDATPWSMTLHTDATRGSAAEAYWVPYDVYLALSAPLLRERALQDFVATLCCPMTPSAEGQSQLVKIDSVFSFLLHGNAVAPPIASAPAVVAPVSTFQSPMQSSSSLHWSEHGSRNSKAELIAFPLFCVLGAKLCTVSRRTRSICSIHTPEAPIAARLATHPNQRGGYGSHSRHGSDRADLTYPAVQQDLAAKPCSGTEASLPRHDGGRDHVLLLFAEQLISGLPGFPVALLYTTSPTGAVVSAPPAEASAFWDSWHKTPRAVRRSVAYEHIWSVVTLPRLVAMLQRWGVAPAVAMRRLCVGLHCSSTSPLEPPGKPHPLHATMNIAHGQGEEATAAAAAAPDTAGALRRPQLPLAEPDSCLVESPPPIPTAAPAQPARASVVGPPQHIVDSSSSDGAAWESLSSDAGVVPHRGMSTPAMRGAEVAVRAPATPLERRGRVTAGEFGTCGVTTPRSQDGLLSSGEKGDAGDPVHPYNALGAPGSVNTGPEDNRGLYGQAHLYYTSSSPPPPAASSVKTTAGSVLFVRSAVSGRPLTESSTPLFNTRRFRYPDVLHPPLRLRLHTSSFLERANGPVRVTRGAAMLPTPRCSGAPKRVTAVPTDARYSDSGALAHPYEVPASDTTRQSGNRHRRRHSGTGSRLVHQDDHRRGTNVRDAPAELVHASGDVEQLGDARQVSARRSSVDGLTDRGRVSSHAAAPALTPTPPTRNGSGCCLGARQRTEHVNRYMQVLMSAAALRRASPSPTATDDFPQQQQNTAHRYSTGDHLAAAAGATPLCVASSSSGTGSNTKGSLNRSRESGDRGMAMPRRAPVPPPPLQQHQLHLHRSPHANILLCHQSSMSTQSSFTSSSLTGGAVSVALSDHAASVTAEHENKQLGDDGNTDRRAGAVAAPSTFAGDSKIPSMTTSSEGSLASVADAAGTLPTAQVSLHPEAASLWSVKNARTHNAARNGIEDSLSKRLTRSPLRSIFTGLRALLQLATPPSSMQARGFPHRDAKPAGPQLSPCSPEDRAVRPCVHAPPELSSSLLTYSSHPTLYAAADAAASPPPSDVLSPPGQHSLTLRASCERSASCLVTASSEENLSPPLRHNRGSVVNHFAVAGASARPWALPTSGFSAINGCTAKVRPLSANESDHGAECRLVSEPAISVDLQLHAAAREHAANAQAVTAPGAVRHDGATAVAASTAAPPVSPGCQPCAASLHLSRRLADALVDSTLHEGGGWPSFLPLSLLGPTLAVATQFPGDTGGFRAAVPTLANSESGLLSWWIDTAALLMSLLACVVQAVGRGYVARRDLRRLFRRPSSSPTERAAVSMTIAAAAPAVTRSPHHTLVTRDPSLSSSPTASASASPVPPIVHHHGVATLAATAAFSVDHFPGSHRPSASTQMASSSRVLAMQPPQGCPPPPQGCPPPPQTAFSTSLTFSINATVAEASTTPSDVHVSARDVSLVATTTPKSSLQRHNAASQTSPKSNKIPTFSSFATDATHSSPKNLSSFSGVRLKQPTRSLDTASQKKVPAPPLRHLFAMCGLQSSSTSEDSGTWAPAPSVEAAGDAAASSDEDDAAAAASNASACPSIDAATLLRAISKYTISTTPDVVPQGRSSDASRGHELPSPSTHGDNNAGGEPSGGAAAPACLVAGEPLGLLAQPSLLRFATSLKLQSSTEDADTTAFRESTAEWMGMMQQQLAVTPSCTVPFLDQAAAKGPPASTLGSSNSQGPISPDGARSSSCRLSSSADEYAAPMVAESLLQLQRIGRGCLIRRRCELSYRERQEKALDLLHKRACQHTPVLSTCATSMEEDGIADGFGGGSTAGGAAAALSGITGLRSASSSYQTSDRTRLTGSLPQSTPSLPGASRPLVTLMAGQRRLSPVNGRHFTDLAHPASLLSQAEPNLSGPEGVVGIVGDSAQLADDRSTAVTFRGKTNTMAVPSDSGKYIASPAFVSSKRRPSVLFTDAPPHMPSSGSLSEPRGAAAGGTEDGTAAASGSVQEAGATQAHRGSLPSSAPPPAAVKAADADRGDDDAAVESPLVPSPTVVLPSSSAAVPVETNDSARKAQPPTGRAPSPPRPSLLSPPSLRVPFSRDSYLSSANPVTMKTPVSAAAAVVPVTSAVGTSISATMSDSSSRQASRSEGAYSMRSPYRSPSSPFTVQGSPHTDMVGAAVDSNDASCCPLPRRRFLIAVPRAELSPMEGSIVATSGRSARSLNSINSLPFNCSTTANTTSVTAQIFSTSLPEGMTPELWVLDGVEEAAMSSSVSDGSDDDDADDNEGDAFKADLIHVEGGAEPACFVAAAQVLGREAAPPLMSKALLLLQRIGRGYLCRRHQHFLFMVSISWTEIALMRRVALGFLTRRRTGLDFFVHREANRQMAYWELRHRSAVLMQSVVRGFNARQRVKRLQRRVCTRIELRTALEQQNTDE
ncbi:hypothetical protein, unknown function [Leishmania infantum JPCM5]|uniref:IQ_calmodulin-binding_motif_containing_protein_-_putative n=2 Tax=Leishmania infantum TaxID=5671 RepID=A0A6L0XKL5_LEIIN|nr:hypothetical protein, unknown function [Leishmania infantum JPCM5]CAC9512901.1 IQ_calmodulin-binding_motif_containing_protein_-_putative [Leishmania infantum]CAM70008.1 hypothetical protein, unknown function [Leishmania infantum JPCM5]SUZ43928.1 IQ_calmodulin-binding_motif_containing_protein_-_putative [Leishmania infantum]|eukprot:XP_001466958.1 hypothetical protein, unknown function [Leishmania infantum JPCM5]